MLGVGALGRVHGGSGLGCWSRVMGVVGLVLELSACAIDERTVEAIDTVAASGAAGRAGAGATGAAADGGAPNGGSDAGGGGNGGRPAPDKLDLLFMIDNSISMSDKQEILRLAVSDLMDRLVNPIC